MTSPSNEPTANAEAPSTDNMLETPKRFIFSDADMAKFTDSPAKANLLRLVSAMGKSCATPSPTYKYNPATPWIGLSPALACWLGSLTEMQATWRSDFPPSDPSQARFGNPQFRAWHSRLVERSIAMVHAILKVHAEQPAPHENGEYDESLLLAAHETGQEAAKTVMTLESIEPRQDRLVIGELCAYLHDAFGHAVRLDYGTGHESSYQVFLYALCKLGCFGAAEQTSEPSSSETPPGPPSTQRLQAITISLYHAYLKVTRQLQTDYMLEPAGSHGVWGLDDYHCLPFYFGACQLQAQENGSSNMGDVMKPNCIHDTSLLHADSEVCDQYLYLGCIRYIQQLKKGVPFFESSPMLNDISLTLPTWQKVAAGLLRLYEGEVLNKRQVVQHFVFGNLFAADWTPTASPAAPPPGTFRDAALPTGGRAPWAAMPSTRAPWANGQDGGAGAVMPSTRAPWAKDNDGSSPAAAMPPTKAPWAKN